MLIVINLSKEQNPIAISACEKVVRLKKARCLIDVRTTRAKHRHLVTKDTGAKIWIPDKILNVWVSDSNNRDVFIFVAQPHQVHQPSIPHMIWLYPFQEQIDISEMLGNTFDDWPAIKFTSGFSVGKVAYSF